MRDGTLIKPAQNTETKQCVNTALSELVHSGSNYSCLGVMMDSLCLQCLKRETDFKTPL